MSPDELLGTPDFSESPVLQFFLNFSVQPPIFRMSRFPYVHETLGTPSIFANVPFFLRPSSFLKDFVRPQYSFLFNKVAYHATPLYYTVAKGPSWGVTRKIEKHDIQTKWDI